MKICRCDTMKEARKIVGEIEEEKSLRSPQNNAPSLLDSIFNDTMGMLVTGEDVEVKTSRNSHLKAAQSLNR